MTVVEDVKQQTEELLDDAKPWVVRLARLGFIAKGIVYATTGLLALQAAFGARSAEVDQESALLQIGSQPLGKILLLIIALGLGGYVAWQMVRAFVDPENAGAHPKGLFMRAGFLVEGIVYAGMAWTALGILIGQFGSSEPERELLLARLITYPAGRWLIGTAGLVMLVIGLVQLMRVYRADFVEDCKLWEMSTAEQTWVTSFGRAGYAGRSLVYAIIGFFLLQAAWIYDSEKAGDLGDALKTLAAQPYGPLILGTVGAGLIAYGAYAIGLATYRRFIIH